jgi:hypothetical protein
VVRIGSHDLDVLYREFTNTDYKLSGQGSTAVREGLRDLSAADPLGNRIVLYGNHSD